MRRHGMVAVCIALLAVFAALSYGAARGKSATSDEPLHAVGGFIKWHFGDFRHNPEDPALFGYLAALPHGRDAIVIDTTHANFRVLTTDIQYAWDFSMGAIYRTPLRGGEIRAPVDGVFRSLAGGPTTGMRIEAETTIGAVDARAVAAGRGGRVLLLARDGRPVIRGDLLGIVIDPEMFIGRSRAVFTLVGVLLGALLCWWSWRLGGPVAAVAATAAFALDPTVLAHAPLVKNDLLLSFMLLALTVAIWRFGMDGRWRWLIVAAALCAATVNAKFSGVLAAPMILALLATRALLPWSWRALGSERVTVRSRLVAAALASAIFLGVSVLGIWGAYRFRFAPERGGTLLNTEQMVSVARASALVAGRPASDTTSPTAAEFDAQKPGLVIRSALWMMDRRLLPQGWLHGFIHTYATVLQRPSFLLGRVSTSGWWYYFPLAMLFKLPVTTLVALLVAVAWGGRALTRRLRQRRGLAEDTDAVNRPGVPLVSSRATSAWMLACLAIPPGIYGLSALTSNINIGVRHVLPLFPFLFIAIGLVASHAVDRYGRVAARTGAGLGLLLAMETAAAYPHFLAFFNVAARQLPGARDGLGLLGDSNLDWGQDLPLLAAWQRTHPERPLYLSYFGNADPQAYGIAYRNLPYGFQWGPAESQVDSPGWIAISATNLQGMYTEDYYRQLRDGKVAARLIAVLGGSIYIYEWDGAGPMIPGGSGAPR